MRHQRCGRCPTSGPGRQLVTAGIKIGPMTIQHDPTPQHLPSGASKDPHGHSLAPDIQGKSHARGDSATAASSRQEMAAHNHLEGHSEVSYHQTECLTPYEPQENNTCNTDTASQAILSSKPPNSPNQHQDEDPTPDNAHGTSNLSIQTHSTIQQDPGKQHPLACRPTRHFHINTSPSTILSIPTALSLSTSTYQDAT